MVVVFRPFDHCAWAFDWNRLNDRQAYLDALGDQAARYDRNTVADIVFDVNKGALDGADSVSAVWQGLLGGASSSAMSWSTFWASLRKAMNPG